MNYDGDFTPTRKKEKKTFDVYKIETQYYNDWEEDASIQTFIGRTMAVSAVQAIHNVAHRRGEQTNQVIPLKDGSITIKYIAEVVQNDCPRRYETATGKAP